MRSPPPRDLRAESRVADLEEALRLHRSVREHMAAAVPALRAASEAALASSPKDSPPDLLGLVLRDAARRIQAAVSAWNDREASEERRSADEQAARDRASALVKEALTHLSRAAQSQLDLEAAVSRNASNRAARAHDRLQVRVLGRALAGATAVASRLLRTLSSASSRRYADLLETVSDPDHPG